MISWAQIPPTSYTVVQDSVKNSVAQVKRQPQRYSPYKEFKLIGAHFLPSDSGGAVGLVDQMLTVYW